MYIYIYMYIFVSVCSTISLTLQVHFWYCPGCHINSKRNCTCYSPPGVYFRPFFALFLYHYFLVFLSLENSSIFSHQTWFITL